MSYYFLEIGLMYLSAISVPGPSILLIIQNALVRSRRAAIFTSLGITTGIALQFGLIILGLNLFEPGSIIMRAYKNIILFIFDIFGIQVYFERNK